MNKYSAYEEGFVDGYEEMIKEAAKAGLIKRVGRGIKEYAGAGKRGVKAVGRQRKKIRAEKKYYGKQIKGQKAYGKKYDDKKWAKGESKKSKKYMSGAISDIKKKGLGMSPKDKQRLRNMAIGGGGAAGGAGLGAAGMYAGRD